MSFTAKNAKDAKNGNGGERVTATTAYLCCVVRGLFVAPTSLEAWGL
jgi:hypothetical protein